MKRTERLLTWTLFIVALVFLGAIGNNIVQGQKTLAEYADSEYLSKQSARIPMQTRNMVNRAVARCALSTGSKSKEERDRFLDLCLTDFEAAMAQVSGDSILLQSNKDIYKRISSMYEIAQHITPATINNLNIMASEIDDSLGENEVETWNKISDRYSSILKTLRLQNEFSIWALVGITIIIIMIGTLIVLKQRADEAASLARQELESQRVQLVQSSKMSTLGEMASGIAHEINNPLTVISSKAAKIKTLAKQGKLEAEAAIEAADKISNMTYRIVTIIKGLRNFARDGEKDAFESVAVSSLLNDVLVLCETKLKNHNIKLELPSVDPSLMIDCRSTQISQVLLNLIGNSFDAIEKLDNKWIRVEFLLSDANYRFNVIDSGPGIPSKVREKMFNPFFTTKEVGKGTGLGLSISAGIIKAHNGRLEYDETCPNTCIYFTIPKGLLNRKAA